jgi:hypothetical protein
MSLWMRIKIIYSVIFFRHTWSKREQKLWLWTKPQVEISIKPLLNTNTQILTIVTKERDAYREEIERLSCIIRSNGIRCSLGLNPVVDCRNTPCDSCTGREV